ncbi:SPW repeat protein [Fulvivirga ulvae]|uniref:SPW repeat protein n=1 Tax=Fulvivirga ulvae TaxID=2904245 RepID=UPI001F36802F|nr:SPW repeat protein [Fulvivirga ulvae]UII34467.1 SPW repeat protein [Fulvivirga ulvae]
MWALVINIILGLWIMASPDILSFADPVAADNNHIVGPLIITFAFTALWEATRTVGKWNIPLGAWLFIAPWALSFEDKNALVNDMIIGAVVFLLSFVKGKITQHFGGGWIALFKRNPEHIQKTK